MATLETQYKNYLIDNPDSELTFDEWKVKLGEDMKNALDDLYRNNKDLCEKHWTLKKEGTCSKCIEENNK